MKRILAALFLGLALCATAAHAQTLTAKYLGPTGEDLVNGANQVPNGIPDWHFRITGMTGLPVKVRVCKGDCSAGQWEWPYNGTNWIIVHHWDADSHGADLLVEPYGQPEMLNIQLTYPDATTASAAIVPAEPVSTQAALLYEVRQSRLPDIDTVDNAERNGAIVMPYTPDVSTFVSTNLTPGTTYYQNVLVKDEAGNKSAYKMTQLITPPLPPPPGSTPPVVTFTAPALNALLTAKSVTVSATAQDDGGVVSFSIYAEGVLLKTVTSPAGNPTTMSTPWNTSPYKGKVVRLYASAKDADGQITTTTITVSVKK